MNRLVYYEIVDTMETAIARDKQIKRYRRDWKPTLIERQNPMWSDLAVDLGLPPPTVALGAKVDPGTRPDDKGNPSPRTCSGVNRGTGNAVQERVPCVYILASAFNGTLYTSVTSNLIGRVRQHRDGSFGGFTKRYGVTRLVYYEVAETMETAIAREKQIKRYRRDWKRTLIERQNSMWNDLAVDLGLPPLTVVPGVRVPGTRPG